LEIYPGGVDVAGEGYVSIYLHHRSEGSIAVKYELMIINKFGKYKETMKEFSHSFEDIDEGYGCSNFMKRSAILGESQNILDSNGTLSVGVSIKEDPWGVFVPRNPLNKMIQGMFLDEDTADVCFEVTSEAKEGKKEAKASDLFHAHSLILKTCAPMLADLFDLEDNDGKIATATITDINPNIFRHLLWYVYGGSVKKEDLIAHAKDIIDTADKYSIVNLKLEAEAAYVKSIDVTIETAVEILLYADAKNCALLKETVVDFLAANCDDVIDEVSFKDVPGHLMKDLLVAMARGKKKSHGGVAFDHTKGGYCADGLKVLSVSELRIKLDEIGLDVDGSREAMIEALKFDEDSEEGSYVKVDEGSGVPSREEGENDEE
jgi:speckle-type POZ protein